MATDGRKTDTKKVLARVATMRSRSQIEALEDFINRYTDDDLLQVNVRLSHLEASWTSFEAANLKLETLEKEEAALVILFKERNMLFERYCKAKGFLTSKVPQESTTSVTVNSADVSVSSLSKLRLPKLDLPTFDGNTTEWLSFKDRFISMIDASPDLTPVMKLQYLLSVLKGDVAKRFQQVTLIADNYNTTWQALLDRYDNVRALKREYFRALTSIPPMKGESIEELRRVTDEFHRLTQGLSALDEPIALWNTPLCNLLFYKLDAKTLLAWEEFSCNETEDSYKKLQEFLQKRLRILVATNHSTHDVQRPSTSKVAGTKPITRLANASFVPSSSSKCYACDDSHYLHQCIKFKEMSLSQKDSLIASHKLCRNCFRTGHVAKGCQSKFRCHKCQQRHHTLLHIHQAMPEVSTPDNLIVATTACNTNLTVLLQTAMVCVIDDDGNVFKARALLDSGSMSNFMSTALAKRLSNKIQNENVSIIGIGKSESLIRHSVNATISSHAENFRTRLNFLVLDSPTSCLPTIDVDIRDWKIEELVLADPMFNTPGPIDIVIGGDTFWKVQSKERICIGSDKPSLIKTKFGWTVVGSVAIEGQDHPFSSNLAIGSKTLEATLQIFWEIDNISPSNVDQQDDNPCEQLFSTTTVRNAEGKFVVRLPKIDNPTVILGASKEIALKRFANIERRLQRNPKMYEQYKQFLKEYETLGHMEVLSDDLHDSIPHCYLPHHPVVKESSTTTKVRVVFDASCKTESGYSLNDILRVGPIVQNELFSTILHFRTNPIALCADIEKMYRQIEVHSDDQALQCIVWRPDASQEIKGYALKTVTYGTACAPFLATRALIQIAHRRASDVHTATLLQQNVTRLLNQYGFSLRKWASNDSRVLENIKDEDLASPKGLEFLQDNPITTLGLVWKPQNDTFCYNIKNNPVPIANTKRQLLSSVAQIFDPLGLIGPVVCKAKLMMQQAWNIIDADMGKSIDWDKQLPAKLLGSWKPFQQTLHLLKQLHIPRFIFGIDSENCELHIFGDASERAYGSCCYVRIKSSHGIATHLLTAKSKLAPIKSHFTIAKLELCAALLNVQLFQKIIAALRFAPASVTFWSDSTTVLHWLNSSPSRWKTFVANRTSQILHTTNISQWRHIAGDANPADDISRGMDPADIIYSSRWWFGPKWLSDTSEAWPTSLFSIDEGTTTKEESRNPTVTFMATVATTFCDELVSKYSSYTRLQRVVAYCIRFISKVRHHPHKPADKVIPENWNPWLTSDELQKAEVALCALQQKQMFSDELHALQKGRPIPRSSGLRWVNPKLTDDGLIRVGGRLLNASVPASFKHPIVLSSKHQLTIMLVEEYHKKLLHAGPELMLASLRQRFWILGARKLIRAIYHRCVTCFKRNPAFIEQVVADLPAARVTPTRPFSVSGVDYCGLFFVKFGARRATPRKVYIAIFVCFSTCAAHIEVVTDLTTAAFIAALQRFVARRGRVKELHSDNGTAFKGAANQLHHLYQQLKTDEKSRELIFGWCAINEIVWKFIPPRAPHFGGLWEAAVKSVKQHLQKQLGDSTIMYEDFLTLCAQIEMCLNSRPLTPIPSETNDLDVLTPGHFLTGSNYQMVPDVSLTDIPDNRLTHWQRTQKLLQGIWARWYPEYLQQLQARATKHSKPPVTIEVGRVVILKEDNIPPAQWPLARITAIHPGRDQIVQVVTLRTSDHKTIMRPVVRIALLPINN